MGLRCCAERAGGLPSGRGDGEPQWEWAAVPLEFPPGWRPIAAPQAMVQLLVRW